MTEIAVMVLSIFLRDLDLAVRLGWETMILTSSAMEVPTDLAVVPTGQGGRIDLVAREVPANRPVISLEVAVEIWEAPSRLELEEPVGLDPSRQLLGAEVSTEATNPLRTLRTVRTGLQEMTDPTGLNLVPPT